MHKKAAAGSWRLASRAKRTSHRQRSVCCCAGGSLLRDAQAKLTPPPPAAVFSTHGSSGAATPRRHGPLRRYDGSVQVRFNAIRDRQACAERVAFATSRTLPSACGRTGATALSSSVVFSPRCPATIEARGLTMPQSSISNWNGARSSATACKREREALRQVSLRSL